MQEPKRSQELYLELWTFSRNCRKAGDQIHQDLPFIKSRKFTKIPAVTQWQFYSNFNCEYGYNTRSMNL